MVAMGLMGQLFHRHDGSIVAATAGVFVVGLDALPQLVLFHPHSSTTATTPSPEVYLGPLTAPHLLAFIVARTHDAQDAQLAQVRARVLATVRALGQAYADGVQK
eukprot:SAG11_NODE_9679_length_890_cov_1.302149_1_plen_105_part_00